MRSRLQGLFHTQRSFNRQSSAVIQKMVHLFRDFMHVVVLLGGSGPDAAGYLSGNGLLTAISLGYVAGKSIKQLNYKFHYYKTLTVAPFESTFDKAPNLPILVWK